MSDLDAGATLNLRIDTKQADAALDRLQDKYRGLINALNAGVKPVEVSTNEAAAQIKTLTTHVATLEAQLQKVGKTNALSQLSKMSAAQSAEEIASRKKAIAELARMSAAGSAEEIASRKKAIAELARMSAAGSAEEIASRKKAIAELARMSAAQSAEEIASRKKAALLQDLNLSGQRAAELAKIKAADTAFVAESRRLWKAWQADQKLQDLNLSGQRAAELAKIKAADTAFVAESRRLWKAWQADQARLAQWSALSQKQQLSLALKSATVSAAGGNASLLPGLAGSAQAAAMAQQGVASLEQQLSKLTPATHAAAKAHQGLGVAFGDTHALARGLSGSLGQLWMTYGNIAPLLVGAALGSAFKNAMQFGAEMEYQLTFVKALGGESAAAMDRLNETALNLGKSSLVGPVELASGLRILAQAGLTADQAIQALPKTLDLAIVGEMKMEEAAITLAGVMNAFSLSVGDIGHIGDVFAKAAAMSQSSVVDMTNAMRTASVVGEQYGVSMEDTAAALTLLAKVNIKGTAAGTALRNMVKELYAPTAQSAAVMKKLGLETADATGNIRPMADVIYDLRGKLSAFDKASQVNILQKLFGERGAKEAIAMLSLTREEWDKLVGKLEGADGFMRNVAAQLEQTTKGVFLQAKNALQGGLVEAFQATDGAAKQLAISLRDLANSGVLAAGIEILVVSLTNLANVAAQAAPALLLVAEAWAATKLLAAANAGWAAAVALMGRVGASATLLGQTMSAVSVGAASAVTGATGLVGALSLLRAAIASLLGPVGLTVTALTGLYLLYDKLKGQTPANVTAIENYSRALSEQVTQLRLTNIELEKKKQFERGSSGSFDIGDFEKRIGQMREQKVALETALRVYRDGKAHYTKEQLDDMRSQLSELNRALIDDQRNYTEARNLTFKIENANLADFVKEQRKQIKILKEDASDSGSVVDTTWVELMLGDLESNKYAANEIARLQRRVVAEMNSLANTSMPSGSTKFEMADTKVGFDSYFAKQAEDLRDGYQTLLATYSEYDEEMKRLVENGTISLSMLHDARYGALQGKLATIEAQYAEAVAQIEDDDKLAKDQKAKAAEIAAANKAYVSAMKAVRIEIAKEQSATVADAEQFNIDIAKALEKAGLEAGFTLEPVEEAYAKFDSEFGKIIKRINIRIGELNADSPELNGLVATLGRLNNIKITLGDMADLQSQLKAYEKEFDKFVKQLENKKVDVDGMGIFGIFGGIEEFNRWKQIYITKLEAEIAALQVRLDSLDVGDSRRKEIEVEITLHKEALKKANRTIAQQIEDWGDSLGEVVSEGLVYGFDQGESPAKKFANYLKSELYKAIAAALATQYKLGLNSIFGGGGSTGSVQSTLGGGSSGVGSFGGAGNLLNAGSNAYSLFGGSGMLSAGSSLAGGSGLYGSFAASSLGQTLGLSAATTTAEGVAITSLTEFGAAVPYIAAAVAAISLLSKESTPHAGGIAYSSGDGYANPTTVAGIRSYYDDAANAAWNRDWATMPYNAQNMLESDWTKRFDAQLGQSLGTAAEGFAKTFNDILIENGKQAGYTFGVAVSADGDDPARGRASITDASGEIVAGYRDVNDLGKELNAATQTVLTKEVPQMMLSALEGMDVNSLADAYLDSLNIEQLSADAAQQALEFVAATDEIIAAFDRLGIAASPELITALGGIDSAIGKISGYYDALYSGEEKTAIMSQQLSDQFADLNLVMPATKDEFRGLIESLDLTTDSGRSTYAALIGLAPAFGTVADAAEAAAQQAMDAAAKAAEEAARIAEEAARAQAEMLALRQDWQDRLDVLTGVKTQREVDLVSDLEGVTDEQTRSLIELYYAQLDITDAQNAAAAAAAAAAEKQRAAAAEMRQAWQSIADGLFDTIRRIRGDMAESSPQGFASLQSQFAILTAQARAGSQGAAGQLGGVATSLVDAAKLNSVSYADYARIASSTTTSLADTAVSFPGVSMPDDLAGILTGGQAQATRDAQAIRDEIRVLRAEIRALRTASDKTAQILDDAARGKNPLTTEAVA